MRAFFKFMFERLTDQLGLPINPIYEYIILAVIGLVAYGIAYSTVGDMYHGGLISGRTEGSFFHWLIRLILFVGLWLLTYGAIQVYFFVSANWQIILMIAGSVIGTALLCAGAVAIMRLVKKRRTVNDNA